MSDNELTKGSAEILYIPELDIYRFRANINWYNKSQKDFSKMITGLIPSSAREWRPIEKEWYIQAVSSDGKMEYGEVLIALAEAIFYPLYKFTKKQHQEFSQGQSRSLQIPLTTYEKTFTTIVTEAGIEPPNGTIDSWTKTYRKAAMKLHPDRHPDDKQIAEKMSRLNEAWANIKEQKWKNKENV